MEKEQIKDIADNLDFGMRCFIHRKSKEIKVMPDYDKHPDMDTEVWSADVKEIESNFMDYIEIVGMDSHESFQIMSDFISTVDNETLQGKLIDALNRPKPFRNFKFEVDNSGEYRDKWFRFKEMRLIDWVTRQLKENGF